MNLILLQVYDYYRSETVCKCEFEWMISNISQQNVWLQWFFMSGTRYPLDISE